MKLFYQIGITLYNAIIYVASFIGHTKARKWVHGRNNWETNLLKIKASQATIWIHVASHGEGLMALPLIKKIIKETSYQILLTFYSPSGFENFNYKNKNLIKEYLPKDTKKNAKKLLEIVNPKALIFAKYDLWLNLINECSIQYVPVLLFSGKFHSKQWYFQFYGKWGLSILKKINQILTLDHNSEKLLLDKGFENVKYLGDSRYDQVNTKEQNYINLTLNKPCVLLGSSWIKEEQLIFDLIEEIPNIQWIIAPHEVDTKRIQSITRLFKDKFILYSQLKNNTLEKNILIIDQIGLLAELYSISDMALIGGGFSGELHNIIEPAAKGNIIFYGPNYEEFPEAIEMINNGFAHSIQNKKDLKKWIIYYLENISELKDKKNEAISFSNSKKGVTDKIYQEVMKLI